MRLGTKLTIYLSLIIILVLLGYGYFNILSRRDILIKKMKLEVKSIGQTLKVSLEKISLPKEVEYVQDLIDAIEEYEKTLGVIVYDQGKNLVFRSRSLDEVEPYLELIKRAIREDRSQEKFGFYKKLPIFLYTFPLKDRTKKNIGGVMIFEHTSFVEEDIKKAEWSIGITIIILICGMIGFILFVTRKWLTQPISLLMEAINNMAKGNLNTQIDLQGRDEISILGRAFNQMAINLREARERIVRDGETKLELERNLRQSEKLATIGQLASGLAHEIGTPLNIISGRVELTKRRIEDEIANKNLDIISQQTERITKIIQQVLGFVRKKKPEQKTLYLGTLLETTLDFLDHQIHKQGIKVVKDLKDSLPDVTGDSDLLQQIFLNLILNAIQAMPDGGTLRLSASSKWISKEGLENEQRQYVEVCVEDTGVGMDREVILNIFNPFFTTKNRGTGLGLMVSQGIIQDHEGWIDVESEIGKGSVFRVYLPSLEGEVRNDG